MFFPEPLVQSLRRNAAETEMGREVRERVTEAARPWYEMADEALWSLVFGPRITRSWMVWSDGYCPACKQGVPMYTWEIDALKRPWKVRCPHCGELFPKNDFAAYHASGLDEHGLFDPARADRSLLFHAEHPGPDDPLRGFGVDDGEGYAADGHRWRFIGAYLIYGQWKQAIVAGVRALAAAYLVTGDTAYARKAGILLDRVADVYPTFDFKAQGLVYEGPGAAGYVSTWHDACEEHRELVLAYDQIRPALARDAELVRFLSARAAAVRLENPKRTWEDVRRNIEERILRDALANRWKINSNYPRTDIALIITLAVLDPTGNRAEALRQTDAMLARATAVDGVTGEKGLANYSALVIQSVAWFLELWNRAEPGFLAARLEAVPSLRQTYRFFSEMRCLDRYYPQSGDSGHGGYASPLPRYVGVAFERPGGDGGSPCFLHDLLPPSMFSFFWALYEATGDAVYVQELYRANGDSVDGLPHDPFATDAEGMRRKVAEVVAREGPRPVLGSVNKTQWHLAILRSGQGPAARAVWLDYDAGGGHGHLDCLNLGLFARGLDLLPELGYPAVQFGGWGSPRAQWSVATAGHNTVAVDGRNQKPAAGRTTLWFDGRLCRSVRAAAPEAASCDRFERTVALADLSPEDAYVLDVFRVAGGRDHTRFVQCGFGTLELPGLTLQDAPDYGAGAQMRRCRRAAGAAPGWRAQWRIEDRYKVLPPGAAVGVSCVELTTDAEAWTAESWVAPEGFNSTREEWLPRLMVRRRAETGPLASTFVAILEPHDGVSRIRHARRLPLKNAAGQTLGDGHAALELTFDDGRRDLWAVLDPEDPAWAGPDRRAACAELGLETDAELLWARLAPAGQVEAMALLRGRRAALPGLAVELRQAVEGIELAWRGEAVEVTAGDRGALEAVRRQ